MPKKEKALPVGGTMAFLFVFILCISMMFTPVSSSIVTETADDYSITKGDLVSGTIDNTHSDDDSTYLNIDPEVHYEGIPPQPVFDYDVEFEFTNVQVDPEYVVNYTIKFNGYDDGSGVNEIIYLYDYDASQWDVIHNGAGLPSSEGDLQIDVTNDVDHYINGSGEMKLRHYSSGLQGFSIYYDYIAIKIYCTGNMDPTNVQVTITNMDDADNCYAKKRAYDFEAIWSDANGPSDINYAELRFNDSASNEIRVRWTESSNTTEVIAGSQYITLGTHSYGESEYQVTITFPITFDWDFGDDNDISIEMYVIDDSEASDGWETKASNYFNVDTDLKISTANWSDDRIDTAGSATISGIIYYDLSSSITPPDGDYNVELYDGVNLVGDDDSISDGQYSITFTGSSSVQSKTYTVNCTDGAGVEEYSKTTPSLITDRIRIDSLGIQGNDRVNVSDAITFYASASLEYDNHPLNNTKSLHSTETAESYSINYGTNISGTISDTHSDDSAYLRIDSAYIEFGFYYNVDFGFTNIQVEFEAVNSFTIKFNGYDGNGVDEVIYLYDYNTSQWDVIYYGAGLPSSEGDLQIDVTSDVDHYISGSGEMMIRHTNSGPVPANMHYDYMAIEIYIADGLSLGGYDFTWDSNDQRFECDISLSSATVFTIDTFTSGYEDYYEITAGNINGKSATGIWDRINVTSLEADTGSVEVGDNVTVSATAALQYGGHELGSADALCLSDYEFTWNSTSQKFEVLIPTNFTETADDRILVMGTEEGYLSYTEEDDENYYNLTTVGLSCDAEIVFIFSDTGFSGEEICKITVFINGYRDTGGISYPEQSVCLWDYNEADWDQIYYTNDEDEPLDNEQEKTIIIAWYVDLENYTCSTQGVKVKYNITYNKILGGDETIHFDYVAVELLDAKIVIDAFTSGYEATFDITSGHMNDLSLDLSVDRLYISGLQTHAIIAKGDDIIDLSGQTSFVKGTPVYISGTVYYSSNNQNISTTENAVEVRVGYRLIGTVNTDTNGLFNFSVPDEFINSKGLHVFKLIPVNSPEGVTLPVKVEKMPLIWVVNLYVPPVDYIIHKGTNEFSKTYSLLAVSSIADGMVFTTQSEEQVLGLITDLEIEWIFELPEPLDAVRELWFTYHSLVDHNADFLQTAVYIENHNTEELELFSDWVCSMGLVKDIIWIGAGWMLNDGLKNLIYDVGGALILDWGFFIGEFYTAIEETLFKYAFTSEGGIWYFYNISDFSEDHIGTDGKVNIFYNLTGFKTYLAEIASLAKTCAVGLMTGGPVGLGVALAGYLIEKAIQTILSLFGFGSPPWLTNFDQIWNYVGLCVQYYGDANIPTPQSVTITDMSDGNNCYANQTYQFECVWEDADGYEDIDCAKFMIVDGANHPIVVKWNQSADTVSIESGSEYVTIAGDHTTVVSESNQTVTVTIPIRFDWDFVDSEGIYIHEYIVDDGGFSTGWYVDKKNYFNVYTDLIITANVNETGVDPGDNITIFGDIYYENSNFTAPPDGDYNVAAYLNGTTLAAQDTSVVNGSYSMDVTVPSTPGRCYYLVNCTDLNGNNTYSATTVIVTDIIRVDALGVEDYEDVYVDNNTSDIDSVADEGIHSNFTAQQLSDSVYDTLTEESTGGGGTPIEDSVDNADSNVDSVADEGTHSNFESMKSKDTNYDTLTEENIGGGVGFVKSIEVVEMNFSTSDTQKSVSLTKGQNISNCIPLLTQTQDGTIDASEKFAFQIFFSSGNVVARRDETGGTANLSISVIEFDDTYVKVQQGNVTIAAWDSYEEASISQVNLSKSFLIAHYKIYNTLDDWYDFSIMFSFVNDSAVRFESVDSWRTVYLTYYVVEALNEEFSVQEKTFDIWEGETVNSTSITSVNMSRTCVFASFCTSVSTHSARYASTVVWLEDSTTLKAKRKGYGLWWDVTLTAYVVEFQGNVYVQRGSFSYSSSDTYKDASINEVNTSQSVVHGIMRSGFGAHLTESSTSGDATVESCSNMLRFVNSTAIEAYHDASGSGGDGYWEVIEFDLSPVESSYGLDLEVQFTTTIDFLPNTTLCIYAGTMGDENLGVDYWNSSAWINLASDLNASSWNNISVSLSDSIFTIRFKGGTEVNDTTQDSWQIDVVLLRYEGSGGEEYIVDNSDSDVDGAGNIGSHGNFTSMQNGPDSTYNTLQETISDGLDIFDGFETGFGNWTNVGGDDFDWTRQTGGTPSSGTGPSGAYNGSYYVYTESSSPNYPSKTAILLGPSIDFSGKVNCQVSFWYHMLGSSMGTLYLEENTSGTWNILWNVSGQQSDNATHWINKVIDLSNLTGTGRLRFRGVTGSSYTSDMCLDDIYVTSTSISDYRIDVEAQWTETPYQLLNEELCIYTGTLGDEDILVDYWNGSTWINLVSDLNASTWNNITITGYLNSGTFTIRFRDGTTSGDNSTQDSWNIDVALIHVWQTAGGYKLDLEIQWINVDYSKDNEYLCIKTGEFTGSEDLKVDVWNGDSWSNIFSSLSDNSWNNVSVSSYLTWDTFTIRFYGADETDDNIQSTWQVDASLLHLYSINDTRVNVNDTVTVYVTASLLFDNHTLVGLCENETADSYALNNGTTDSGTVDNTVADDGSYLQLNSSGDALVDVVFTFADCPWTVSEVNGLKVYLDGYRDSADGNPGQYLYLWDYDLECWTRIWSETELGGLITNDGSGSEVEVNVDYDTVSSEALVGPDEMNPYLFDNVAINNGSSNLQDLIALLNNDTVQAIFEWNKTILENQSQTLFDLDVRYSATVYNDSSIYLIFDGYKTENVNESDPDYSNVNATVQIWNGSDWEELFTINNFNSSNHWNLTISSDYIINSTVKLRIYGSESINEILNDTRTFVHVDRLLLQRVANGGTVIPLEWYADDFENATEWMWKEFGGNYSVEDGKLVISPVDGRCGFIVVGLNVSTSNFRYFEVKVTNCSISGGDKNGFQIVFFTHSYNNSEDAYVTEIVNSSGLHKWDVNSLCGEDNIAIVAIYVYGYNGSVEFDYVRFVNGLSSHVSDDQEMKLRYVIDFNATNKAVYLDYVALDSNINDKLNLSGYEFTWDTTDSRWECNISQSEATSLEFSFADGYEATYGIVNGTMNGNNLTIIWDSLRIENFTQSPMGDNFTVNTLVTFSGFVNYDYDNTTVVNQTNAVDVWVNGSHYTYIDTNSTGGFSWDVPEELRNTPQQNTFEFIPCNSPEGIIIYSDTSGEVTINWYEP